MILDPTPFIPWFIFALLGGGLLLLLRPLGHYMADVFDGKVTFLHGLERALLLLAGQSASGEMNAAAYIRSLVIFSAGNILALYGLFALQEYPEVSFDLAINAAISFVTNTNWQPNAPETSIALPTQMLGLTVQNFISPAVGLAVMAALIRGLARSKTEALGNFWVDMVRAILYILLPLSFLLGFLCLSQGVVQGFGETIGIKALESGNSQAVTIGPVASHVAIKILGSNGGGYFTANAAHPFENPTPLTNVLYLIAIMLLPAAAPFCYGRMCGQPRQSKMIFVTMLAIFIPLCALSLWAEPHPHPLLAAQPGLIDQSMGPMEGKEVRFGVGASTLWATMTTATSNGGTNAALDSFSPISTMTSLLFMQLGEIVFGGVGSGLYGMLIYVLLTVFITGLMIGRTPEYLGKKIGVFEIQMASLILLIPVVTTLLGTALAMTLPMGHALSPNSGASYFTEVLYAFASASNNNGSSLAGLQTDTPFYNLLLGFCMLAGRFGVMIPILAIAGSMSRKACAPPSQGTLDTTTPLFAFLLMGVILLVGALTYVPAMALGPIASQLTLVSMVGGAP